MIGVRYSTVSRPSLAGPAVPVFALAHVEQLYAEWQAADDKCDYISGISAVEAAALCDFITAQVKGGTVVMHPDVRELTLQETLDVLNVTRLALTKLLESSQIVITRQYKRRLFIDRASVERYLAQRKGRRC